MCYTRILCDKNDEHRVYFDGFSFANLTPPARAMPHIRHTYRCELVKFVFRQPFPRQSTIFPAAEGRSESLRSSHERKLSTFGAWMTNLLATSENAYDDGLRQRMSEWAGTGHTVTRLGGIVSCLRQSRQREARHWRRSTAARASRATHHCDGKTHSGGPNEQLVLSGLWVVYGLDYDQEIQQYATVMWCGWSICVRMRLCVGACVCLRPPTRLLLPANVEASSVGRRSLRACLRRLITCSLSCW